MIKFNHVFIFTTIIVFLSACKPQYILKNQDTGGRREVLERIYTYLSVNTPYSIFYVRKENGEMDIFKCRFMSSDGLCYYSDSSLLAWICDTNRIEEFNMDTYNPLDSLSFPNRGYLSVFRDPGRFNRCVSEGKRDTILIKYGMTIHKHSIETDKDGYKRYQRVVLDSFYFLDDTVFVIQVDMLKENNKKQIFLEENSKAEIYHISRRFLLYYKGVSEVFPHQYVPVLEFIKERKFLCPCKTCH